MLLLISSSYSLFGEMYTEYWCMINVDVFVGSSWCLQTGERGQKSVKVEKRMIIDYLCIGYIFGSFV